jgi:hypothetical protein
MWGESKDLRNNLWIMKKRNQLPIDLEDQFAEINLLIGF